MSAILPIIHLNGTSAETLLEGYRAAMDAVQAAQEALGKVEFNARDYYPETGLWEKAISERHSQMASLSEIHESLQEIAVHCFNNLKENRR